MIRNVRLAAGTVALLFAIGLLAPAVGAHSPDPVLSGSLWAQDQVIHFKWRTGEVPAAAMQTAIKTAAGDANRTRSSRAATFAYDPAGSSWINYGLNVGCGVNGLACFSRINAPASFTMSFREQGHVFDWGVLHWCQMTANTPDGCYDAENIALDEFGHVEILNHHVNFDDDHDYLDAVVQTYSRAKPRTGYNVHAFGRCDIASLQREYDVPLTTTRISTCLDLATSLSITSSASSVAYGGSVTLTARLAIANLAEYERLAGNAVSQRAVTIQRRVPGGAWSSVATMTAAAASGTYTFTATSLTKTYDWRAAFAKPATEGLRASTSNVVTTTVSGCTAAPCPLSGTAQ